MRGGGERKEGNERERMRGIDGLMKFPVLFYFLGRSS